MAFLEYNDIDIIALTQNLEANAEPLWGQMNGRQMIEHLVLTMRISLGIIPVEVLTRQENLVRARAFLASDKHLPKHFKAPFYEDDKLPEFEFDSIQTAILVLAGLFLRFEDHFRENDNVEYNHPIFGALGFQDWKRFHEKHFTHHLSQFSLI